MKQVTEPVPDVREVDPLIPESVALWVQRMTEKAPTTASPTPARRGRPSRRRCSSTSARSGAAMPR